MCCDGTLEVEFDEGTWEDLLGDLLREVELLFGSCETGGEVKFETEEDEGDLLGGADCLGESLTFGEPAPLPFSPSPLFSTTSGLAMQSLPIHHTRERETLRLGKIRG